MDHHKNKAREIASEASFGTSMVSQQVKGKSSTERSIVPT